MACLQMFGNTPLALASCPSWKIAPVGSRQFWKRNHFSSCHLLWIGLFNTALARQGAKRFIQIMSRHHIIICLSNFRIFPPSPTESRFTGSQTLHDSPGHAQYISVPTFICAAFRLRNLLGDKVTVVVVLEGAWQVGFVQACREFGIHGFTGQWQKGCGTISVHQYEDFL